jgi:hypothetical protein
VTPANLPLSVRTFNGSPALAADTPQLTEITFTIPICLSGSVDLHTKTLSMMVFFDGTPTTPPGDPPGQFFLQTAIPGPTTGFLTSVSVASETWIAYSAPLSLSSFSASTTQITVQAGSYGGAFSGTIWFDNIMIQ